MSVTQTDFLRRTIVGEKGQEHFQAVQVPRFWSGISEKLGNEFADEHVRGRR